MHGNPGNDWWATLSEVKEYLGIYFDRIKEELDSCHFCVTWSSFALRGKKIEFCGEKNLGFYF